MGDGSWEAVPLGGEVSPLGPAATFDLGCPRRPLVTGDPTRATTPQPRPGGPPASRAGTQRVPLGPCAQDPVPDALASADTSPGGGRRGHSARSATGAAAEARLGARRPDRTRPAPRRDAAPGDGGARGWGRRWPRCGPSRLWKAGPRQWMGIGSEHRARGEETGFPPEPGGSRGSAPGCGERSRSTSQAQDGGGGGE